MGAGQVSEFLPKFVRRVRDEGRHVVWSCDPMHGNTIKAVTGLKTRPFDNILQEVKNVFAVHQAEGSYAGGLHVEMTGQDVTECTGGAQKISDKDLTNSLLEGMLFKRTIGLLYIPRTSNFRIAKTFH